MSGRSPKERLWFWLQDWNPEAIQSQAAHDRRTLSYLLTLTYDSDELISWRAVEAYGLAAAQVAVTDAEYVRNHLRRLVWLLSDESGGIGWRAPEALGEILFHCPSQFIEYIPILVHLIDMEEEDAARFRSGYLRAIARISPVLGSSIQEAIKYILPCLHDKSAEIRGLAALSLGLIAPGKAHKDLVQLLEDQRTLVVYTDQELHTVSVAALAAQALELRDNKY